MSAELLDVGIAVGTLLIGIVAGATGIRRLGNGGGNSRDFSSCPMYSGVDERLKALKGDVETMKGQINAIHQKVCAL